jgi:hypothetical protein
VLDLLAPSEQPEVSIESTPETRAIARGELVHLLTSLRDDGPSGSVLGSLVMENPQSIGSIAASVGVDVEVVESIVLALQVEGWVQVEQAENVERVRLMLLDE